MGANQILFLHFDGAKIGFLNGTAVGPIVDALPSWGLTAADRPDGIDACRRFTPSQLGDQIIAGQARDLIFAVRAVRTNAYTPVNEIYVAARNSGWDAPATPPLRG